MSTLDRIRRELAEETASLPDPAPLAGDPAFDIELAAALDGLELTDEFIEAIIALAEPARATLVPQPLPQAALRAVREHARIQDIAALRKEHGIPADAAARILDVSVGALERLESRGGLAWLNLPAARVGRYLERVGVNAAEFVRSIAAGLPEGPTYAYGYRPRAIPDEALALDEPRDDLERLVAWSHELLSQQS